MTADRDFADNIKEDIRQTLKYLWTLQESAQSAVANKFLPESERSYYRKKLKIAKDAVHAFEQEFLDSL